MATLAKISEVGEYIGTLCSIENIGTSTKVKWCITILSN
jgi:hypothetical protein